MIEILPIKKDDLSNMLTSVDKRLENINTKIDEQLNVRKNFWLDEMTHAKTAEALKIWYEAMMAQTTELTHYNTETNIGMQWANECEMIYQKQIKNLPQIKPFLKNHSWLVMGVAIAAVGIAAAATPVLAAGSIGVAVASVGYAVFDAGLKVQTSMKNRKTELSRGKILTDRLNLGTSLSSLAIGGIALGLVLTGVCPPVGALVLAVVVSLPFVTKLALRARKNHLRQQEINQASKQTHEAISSIKDLMTLKKELQSEKSDILKEKDLMHPHPTLSEAQINQHQKIDEYEKRLAILYKPPAPIPMPSHVQSHHKKQDKPEEEEHLFSRH